MVGSRARMATAQRRPGNASGDPARLVARAHGSVGLEPSGDRQIFGWATILLLTGVFLYVFRKWRSRCGGSSNGANDRLSAASSLSLSAAESGYGGSRFEEGARDRAPSPLRRKRHDSNANIGSVEMVRIPILRGIDDTDPCMLQRRQISRLCALLPPATQLCEWVLLYASARDGYSLETFYQLCEQQGPTILIVSDTSGVLFGAYHSTSWRRPTGADEYYGTGECFVFRESKAGGNGAARSDSVHTAVDNSVWQKYGWTGNTDEFVFSGHDIIGFGGGGKFALTLDSNFRQGSSEASPTFGNPSLASSTMFTVASVEVWSFQTSW